MGSTCGSPAWRWTAPARSGSPGARTPAATGTFIAGRMTRRPARWSAVERLTHEPGADINVVSATDSQGRVWWAWQGRRGKHFQIFLLGPTPGAADRRDRQAGQPLGPGHCRRLPRPGLRGLGRLRAAATTTSFCGGSARAGRAGRARGGHARLLKPARVWPSIARIACGSAMKRAEPTGARILAARCRPASATVSKNGGKRPGHGSRGRRMSATARASLSTAAAASWSSATPMAGCSSRRPIWQGAGVDRRTPRASPASSVRHDGRLWLLLPASSACPAAPARTWASYALSYDGQRWSLPQLLPDSDNLLDNRPAAVPYGPDGLLAVYSSDARLRGADRREDEAIGR